MPKLVLVWCALAVAIGCAGRPRIERPRDEWLAEIRIEGNPSVAASALVPGLASTRTMRGGRAVDGYQLGVDVQRIRAAYLRRGFFEVNVTARIDTEPRDGTTAQIVVFTVVEGRRSTSQVVMRGLPPEVDPARARALVKLADGAPFDYGAYDAAKQPLIRMLQDAGYPQAQVDAAVLADRARAVATARFDIEAGPRAVFGEVSIDGTEGDLARAITNRLAFAPGEPYSMSALAASQRAIYELGRFSTVRIQADSTAGTVVPVRIIVARASRRETRLGGGLGYDPVTAEVRGRAAHTHVLEDHPLWTFAFDGRPAISVLHDLSDPRLKIRATGSLERLDLFRPHVRGELEASLDYLKLEAFTTGGGRFRAGVSAPLGAPWLRGRIGWLLEYLQFTETRVVESARIELGLDEPQRRGAFELAIDADRRDDQIEPRRGLFASMRATFGTPYAGGAMRYLQLTPELRGYVPFGGHVVLAMRGRLGLLLGEVPVTERYFSGGASYHRGFPDRRLSPTVAGYVDGEPAEVVVGGTRLLELGAELRISLGEPRLPVTGSLPLGLHLFLDGGDVVDGTELDPASLHWATGLGIYFKIAGLKIRGDVGYRLNRTGAGEPRPGDRFVVHFGIGDAF